MTERILDCHLETLSRPRTTFRAFNDVYGAERGDKPEDFDAVLTTEARSLIEPDYFREFGIGADPGRGAYAASLVVSLQDVRQRRLDQVSQTHPEIQRLQKLYSETTSHVIINTAPRSKQTGANGTGFYLAITDNGVAIWVTPLELLKYLGSERRTVALYKVPNEGHQVFPDGEQFRSSVVPSFRFYPELLIPVFQYETRAELLSALENKNPPKFPRQQEDFEIAFGDKFGNIRVRAERLQLFFEKLDQYCGIYNTVGIQLPHSANYLKARIVDTLSGIPDGEVGIFCNVADREFCNGDSGNYGGYFELVRKVSDPNDPEIESAADLLIRVNKGRGVKTGTPIQFCEVDDIPAL